jgi:hypothetical protein
VRHHFWGIGISALMGGALLIGCAGGGSSATQSSDTVPSAVQRAVVPGPVSVGRQAHSGARRPLSVPTCSGTGTHAFVGGGLSNVAGGADSFVGAGQGNQACDQYSAIAGGYFNAVSGSYTDSFIGGGENNVLTDVDSDAAIVAGDHNEVTNAVSAVVAGEGNQVASTYSLIGSGNENTIGSAGTYSAIVSGNENNLSAEYGFIGGGTNNTVSGEGGYIAAGGYNTVTGEGAVIDGGFNSTAGGTFATIPGGYVNSAAGTYSFAAGARASAANEGAFVWSDGSDGDTILTSSRAYEFLARASGGFALYTNAASTVGAQLAAGSGTWASLSDRNAKTNIAPLDDATVLDKVASLPISRWSYKTEHGVRHVGPMAQDFYAAFKVGEDDKHITSIDEDGVALAAIKALHAENGALRTQETTSRGAIATLHTENGVLRRRLAADEAHVRRVDAELAHIVAVLRR